MVVNDLPDDGAAGEVVREIAAAGGTAIANEDSVVDAAESIVGEAIEQFGQLDIVINNAGVVEFAPFEELPPESYRAQVDLFLFASIDLCRAAWPHLKRSGTGRIINTISASVYGGGLQTNYCAGKGGLLGFSRALGFEGEWHNINVNCIGPSAFTRMQEASIDESIHAPFRTHMKPERVAAFVAWLAHQDTDVRNEWFEVGGGQIARVRFAHQPFIRVSENTPEAWAEQSDLVTSDDELMRWTNVLDVARDHLAELEPEFNLDLDEILGRK